MCLLKNTVFSEVIGKKARPIHALQSLHPALGYLNRQTLGKNTKK